MQVFEPKEGQSSGELQVVGADLVNQLTLSGWTLVFSYQEESIVQTTDMVLRPTPPNPGYYGSDTIMTTRNEKILTTRFVMRRDEASALVHSEARANAESSRAAGLARTLAETEKKLVEVEKTFAAEKSHHQSCQSMVTDVRNDLGRSEESRRKLESNIGKIREAIGSKQMEEILGRGKT
jgi:hypothetical protein